MTKIRFQLHEGCKLYEEVNSGLYILVNLFLSTAWLVARYQAANNLSLSKRNFRIYYDTSGPAKAKIKHNHKQVKFNGWYLADQLLAQSVWSFWWHQLEFNRSDPSRRILLVLRRLLRRSICNTLTSTIGCLVPWPGGLDESGFETSERKYKWWGGQ